MHGSSPSSSGIAETGASGREHYGSRGRLEAADGGTVVLQDVGYLSWRLQGRLHRFVGTRMVQRIGSSQATPSDVRLMAITHRSLVQTVQQSGVSRRPLLPDRGDPDRGAAAARAL